MAKTSKADLLLVAALQDRASSGLKALDNQLKSVQRNGVLNIKSFGALDKAAGTFGDVIQGNMGALTAFAGGAGILGLVTAAGAGALALNKMGEESLQIEARFRAFNGGATGAAAALGTMNAAVGLALTQDEQMTASTKLMAGGLATNASEAAKVAEAAIWLGDAHEGALQRVEGLNQALLSGRTRSLIPYGVNMGQLTARVKELQAANGNLTDSEATTQAFMEQAVLLMQRVRDEGGKAVTTTTEFQNAWANMKDAVAAKVSPTIEVIIKGATGVVQGITESMDPVKQAQDQVAYYQKALEVAQTQKIPATQTFEQAFFLAGQGTTPFSVEGLQADQEEAARLKQKLDEARYALNQLLTPTGGFGLSQALIDATDQAQRLKDALEAAKKPWLISGGQAVYGTGKTAWLDWHDAVLQGREKQKQLDKKAEEDAAAKLKQDNEDAAAKLKQDNEDAALAYGRELANQMSRVGGWLTEAISGSKELFNALPGQGKGGIFDDPNGPFRYVRRALDVAAHGTASPWASVLGMDQATAQKIAADFQHGIISPAVEALIDPAQMQAWIDRQNLAERTQKAFAAKWGLALEQGADGAVAGLASKTIAFTAAGAALAQAAIDGFGEAATATDRKRINGYASGGWSSGGLAWVGEGGPELVGLPRGSRVYSAGESRRMVGGPQQVNIVNRAGDTVMIRDRASAALYVETLRTKRLARLAEGF